MKHLASVVIFCLLLSGILGGPLTARASHLLGAELTYASLGNNQYRVKLRVYQDCSGLATPSFTLACRQGSSCTTPATITTQLLPQGAAVQPAPLCPSTPGTCQNPSSQFPLYNFATYEATVTLPPGQWTMSTTQSARPALANIVSGSDLYVEAYLDNSGTNVANNSPQFDADDIPVQYVCRQQRTTFSFSALEADGDSVVYSLAAPLQLCGHSVMYAPYPYFVGCIFPSTPICILQVPSNLGFSPTLPLPVLFDTVGTCPIKTGVPRFKFNQEARTVTFTPAVYIPNSPPASGQNKYLMAVQASEYRRINGVRRLIGRIQHEVAFIVTDCGPDNVPNPVIVTAQPGANARVVNTPDTTQISVYTCQLSRIKLDFTDPDNLRTPSAQQPLTVTMPADINTNPLLLDAGDVGTFSLSGNGTAHPVGTLLLQPAATAAGRIIRLNVRVEDNACPVKARQNRVIVIKVLRGNFARATATTTAGGGTTLVYPGDTLLLQGRTLRPDSVRNIAAGTTLRQTYNYQWSVRGDGLNPTQSTGATIRIAPTVTSRYGLTVMPQLGLAQGACFDTTSVLVTVQPAPVLPPNIVRNGTTLTSSAPTGNQWYLNGQPISGATGQTYTAAAVGTYTVRVTVVVGSRSYTTPPSAPVTLQALAAQHALPGTSVAVTPNPTHDGRLNVVLTGYSQPVALTVLDGLGRTVTHASTAATGAQGTSTLPLDLSALPAGLYLLQVRAGTGLETRRIVRE